MIVAEGFSADIAFIGLLSCVGTHVHLQLLAAGESFTADLAAIWFLACKD